MSAPETDPQFADLLDELLECVLNGEQPDLAAAAARHPSVGDRVAEAYALASSLAGRKATLRPTLSGYEIERELGRGGMGTVYLARQTALDRRVAIKVLPHSFGLSADSRRRFLEEARALARIRHEHIVAIHRIVDDGELLAFEMEFVDGPSLHSLLAKLREQRERTGTPGGIAVVAATLGTTVEQLGARSLTQFFVRLLAKVARALAAVHAAGFVHRDVKPANLLLRTNGDPVVVDFGLVRLRNLEASHAGRFAGTPVYSSPEQLRGDVMVGPAADVYSLGVTLYECLTLSTPFAGRTTTDLLQRIEQGRFRPLRHLAPDAPRDLETIVAHAMEVDPLQRYPDAGALADDLQRLLELHPIRARPVHPLRRGAKFVRRHKRLLLAAAAGAVLVAAALFPVLHAAAAATRARGDARQHLHAAREQIVAIDSAGIDRRWVPLGHTAPQRLLTAAEQRAPLRMALAEYERALQLLPDDDDLRREADVVRLALWLGTLDAPQLRSIADALAGPEFAALTARLGPATVRAARGFAGEPALGTSATAAADAEPADAADRLTLGLLAYLLGDFGRCERCWSDRSAELVDHPLVDAALGRLQLADGVLEPAYARLSQAQRQFPSCASLMLALADAVLQLGDLDRAREWLDRVPPTADRSPTRQRIELDLRAATDGSAELLDAYERLAHDAPDDPTAAHRIAQLALRRGDLAEAATRLDALLQRWPQAAEFRLERARIALQRRDLPAYAQQVLAVLELDFGRDRSRGTVAALLEVLRIGGLERLYLDGVQRSGERATGRTLFGGELPIQGFAPPRVARQFEDSARYVHALTRDTRVLRGAGRRIDDGSAALLVTLPLALTRPPLSALPYDPRTIALLALPWFGPDVYEYWQPFVRALAVGLHPGDWRPVALEPIERPADLQPAAVCGSQLLRIDDATGDGTQDLLLACGSTRPAEAEGRVLLIDGRTAHTVATLRGASPQHLFAFCLASVADLDGDDAPDWLFGCPSGDPTVARGEVELWSGRTRARLRVVTGDEPGFGVSVAGLADCDGDHVPDFAVGTAPLVRNTAAQGRVQVISGRTFAVVRTLRSETPGVWFGATIANVGDADGDGAADLVVGGNYGDAPGLVQLYSVRRGEVLHSWSDGSPDTGFGAFVGAAGDLDADGRADVVVSAIAGNQSGSARPDRVLVYSGRTGEPLLDLAAPRPRTGFGTAVLPYAGRGRDALLAIASPEGGDPATGLVELFSARGECVATVLGARIGGGFGWRLALRPDHDGDGRPELVVGEPSADHNGVVWSVASAQVLRGPRWR